MGAVTACSWVLKLSCAILPASVGVNAFLVTVGFVFGAPVVTVGVVTVLTILGAFGLGAFGVVVVGVVGVPYV